MTELARISPVTVERRRAAAIAEDHDIASTVAVIQKPVA